MHISQYELVFKLDQKNKKHGKASSNLQNVQATCYLKTEHSDAEDTAATITESKSKIIKKEEINRNLLSSYVIEEKDARKRLKRSNQMMLLGALCWRDVASWKNAHWFCSPQNIKNRGNANFITGLDEIVEADEEVWC